MDYDSWPLIDAPAQYYFKLLGTFSWMNCRWAFRDYGFGMSMRFSCRALRLDNCTQFICRSFDLILRSRIAKRGASRFDRRANRLPKRELERHRRTSGHHHVAATRAGLPCTCHRPLRTISAKAQILEDDSYLPTRLSGREVLNGARDSIAPRTPITSRCSIWRLAARQHCGRRSGAKAVFLQARLLLIGNRWGQC